MKTFIIFVLLSVCFVFSNKLINATGFEDLLRLRSKSATLNEGGFIFNKMKRKIYECFICKKEFTNKSGSTRWKYCSKSCSYIANIKEASKRNKKYRSRNNILTTNNFLEILFSYFDYECKVCYKKTNDLEIHHLTPLYKGGRNHINNVIAICSNCHKRIRTPLSCQTDFVMSQFSTKQLLNDY